MKKKNLDRFMKKFKLYSLIGAVSTSVIGSFVYDKVKGEPMLSTFIGILKVVWDSFLLIMNYEIKVWWILIVCVIIIFGIYLIQKFQTEARLEPEFIKYKEDRFKVWKWTWNWRWNSFKNSWEIFDLLAYCPKCGVNLLYYRSILDENYECPNCDFKTGRFDHVAENRQHIEALIIDKVNKK